MKLIPAGHDEEHAVADIAVVSVRLQLTMRFHRAALQLLLVTYTYGLTVNIVESAAFAMALGCVAAFLFGAKQRELETAYIYHQSMAFRNTGWL